MTAFLHISCIRRDDQERYDLICFYRLVSFSSYFAFRNLHVPKLIERWNPSNLSYSYLEIYRCIFPPFTQLSMYVYIQYMHVYDSLKVVLAVKSIYDLWLIFLGKTVSLIHCVLWNFYILHISFGPDSFPHDFVLTLIISICFRFFVSFGITFSYPS